MIKLYDYPDCPFCIKVKVALGEKDLEYETVLVDLAKGEQRTPEFLKLNPYGKVPVLIDDDVVVYDSTVINEYLNEEYPEPPLLPEDSASRARARLLEDYCDSSFLPSAGLVLAELAKPEGDRDQERLKRYQAEVQRGLARLETFLASGEYLVGPFSIADIAFVPRVLVLPRLGVEIDPRLRHVTSWMHRLRERPSVAALRL